MRCARRLTARATGREDMNPLLPKPRPPHQFLNMEAIDPKSGTTGLYRDIIKALPYIKLVFEVPLPLHEMKKRVRIMFDEYQHVQDPEAIRQLLVQGASDFNEVIHHVATQSHVLSYFDFVANRTDFKDYLCVTDPATPTWKALEMQNHNLETQLSSDQQVTLAKRREEREEWLELSLQEKLAALQAVPDDSDTFNLDNPNCELQAIHSCLSGWPHLPKWDAALQQQQKQWNDNVSPEKEQKSFRNFVEAAGIANPHAALARRGDQLRRDFGAFLDNPLHAAVFSTSAYQRFVTDPDRVPALRGPMELLSISNGAHRLSQAQEQNPLTNSAAVSRQTSAIQDLGATWDLPRSSHRDLGVQHLSDLLGLDPRLDAFLKEEIEFRLDWQIHIKMQAVTMMLQSWPLHKKAATVLELLDRPGLDAATLDSKEFGQKASSPQELVAAVVGALTVYTENHDWSQVELPTLV